MSSQPLASAFPKAIVTYKGDDGTVARRERLRWWEDAPGVRSKLQEQHVAQIERERRASRWRANHQTGAAFRCGDAWPPIPLRDGFAYVGMTRGRLNRFADKFELN